MTRRIRAHWSLTQTGVLLAVIVAHVLALLGLDLAFRRDRALLAPVVPMTALLIEREVDRTPPETVPRPQSATSVREPAPSIDVAPESSPESTAPVAIPPIDWELEAQRAVQRFADSLPSEPGQTKPKKKPEFGWSHSRIQRIEQTEDGATLFWINDRCFLVNFMFPMCKFGDMPANGDLFKGMDEWKDQREP